MHTWELTESADLTVEAVDSGVRVTVTETVPEETAVYSMVVAQDFFESQQKRGTMSNKIRENANVSPDAVAEAFEDWCTKMSANSLSEDKKEILRTETVSQLLANTEAVEIYAGEDTRFVVRLSVDGRSAELEFTSAQWANGGPAGLMEQYTNEFLTRIEVGKDEWDDLVEEWQEQSVVKQRESLTEWEVVANGVLERLSGRVVPHESKERFRNGSDVGWYDDREDEPILWVKSGLVADALSDQGKDTTYLSELSKEFNSAGHTKRSTKKVSGKRCYAFVPEALGVNPAKVHTEGDEEPEVEP